MKNKLSLFYVLPLVLFFLGTGLQTAQAQVATTCDDCKARVVDINMVNFPFQSNFKVFAATVGGYNLPGCTLVGYEWDVPGLPPSALQPAGGHCKVIFPGPGTYQVCVKVTYSIQDPYGNTIICEEREVLYCEEFQI